jgi:hypothetical protein
MSSELSLPYLVDVGVVLSILGEETRNCCFCIIYYDWLKFITFEECEFRV